MGDIINAGADLLGFGPASKAANAQRDAANASAAAQLQAAQIAADAARFRPVGITTGFGQSQFALDDKGNLVSAGYTLSPELQAIRNRLLSQASAYDPTQVSQAAQGLLSAGQGYISASPEQARQQYISQQQALLAPQNEQALANIRNQQFQTGRTGLATGGTSAGGLAQTNPEMAAYYNALAQQNAQLAAGAEAAAQQRQSFGAGLLGQVPALTSAAYTPLSTQLGLGSTIEGLGQQALGLGSELGGRASTAGAQAGQSLLLGGLGAARTIGATAALPGMAQAKSMAGLLNNPALSYQNLSQSPYAKQASNWFNNLISPTPYSDRGTMYSNDAGSYSEFDY